MRSTYFPKGNVNLGRLLNKNNFLLSKVHFLTQIIGRQNIVEKLLNYFNAAQYSSQEKQEQHLLPAGAKFNSFSSKVKVTEKRGAPKMKQTA